MTTPHPLAESPPHPEEEALRDAGRDASRLDGHLALEPSHVRSRLVMAGVDLLTVKELGGWRTLAMVQRYAHLAPAHLHAAVERLVPTPVAAVELAASLSPLPLPSPPVYRQYLTRL